MDGIFESNIEMEDQDELIDSENEDEYNFVSKPEPKKQAPSQAVYEDDYYSLSNKSYQEASAYPTIPCPTVIDLDYNMKFIASGRKDAKLPVKFIYISEIQQVTGLTSNNFEVDLSTSEEILNYTTSLANSKRILMTLKDSNFSKEQNRHKISTALQSLDVTNYTKIKEAKNKINPFELVFEDLFQRNSSIQLANIDYLFSFNLLKQDHINETTDIICVGDDGGFIDYLCWRQREYLIKIFNMHPNHSRYSTTKFINADKNEICSIESISLSLNSEESFDRPIGNLEIDDFDMTAQMLENFINEFRSKSEGISMYIAKKKLKLNQDTNEIKFKKFFLINTILALSTLVSDGTFIIKIYESYTNFSVSLLFILYQSFEKLTIVKPFSSHKITASRYVVCEGYKQGKGEEFTGYLLKLFDEYCKLIQNGKDLDSLIKVNQILQDKQFKNYLFESNNEIDEKRIDSLGELISEIKGENIITYDKMGLKKKCLDQWKIPVRKYKPTEEYSYKKQIQMISNSHQSSSHQTSNKAIDLLEKAKMYKDYGNYNSKEGQDLINRLIGDTPSRSINRDNDLHQSRLKTHIDEDCDISTNHQFKPLPDWMTSNKIVEKKKKDSREDSKLSRKRDKPVDSNQLHSKIKAEPSHLTTKVKEEKVKEVMKNREDALSSKVEIDNDIKAKLLAQFKK